MRDKNGRFIKGHILTQEMREKMSAKLRGRKVWNKGKSWSVEIRKRISLTNKQKGIEPKIKYVGYGENSAHWKGGVTTQNQKDRNLFRKTIQKEVFKRDNYTCQICGVRGVSLQVDHIQSWKDYVELRFSIENCRTLCQRCHYQITFGKPMPKNIKTWGHNLTQL